MEDKRSTNTWLVAIVAIVAVVGLVVLYMNAGKQATPAYPAEATPQEEPMAEGTPTGEAFTLPKANVMIPTCTASQTVDADGDGYRVIKPGVACRLSTAADCNDANRAINPGATEICGNTVDEDCDGAVGEGCPTVITCKDSDGDSPTTPGYVSGTQSGPTWSATFNIPDMCVSAAVVNETVCPRPDGYPSTLPTACPAGKTCSGSPGFCQ
jgi:hypothetical protein